jgi:hypothetical protein
MRILDQRAVEEILRLSIEIRNSSIISRGFIEVDSDQEAYRRSSGFGEQPSRARSRSRTQPGGLEQVEFERETPRYVVEDRDYERRYKPFIPAPPPVIISNRVYNDYDNDYEGYKSSSAQPVPIIVNQRRPSRSSSPIVVVRSSDEEASGRTAEAELRRKFDSEMLQKARKERERYGSMEPEASSANERRMKEKSVELERLEREIAMKHRELEQERFRNPPIVRTRPHPISLSQPRHEDIYYASPPPPPQRRQSGRVETLDSLMSELPTANEIKEIVRDELDLHDGTTRTQSHGPLPRSRPSIYGGPPPIPLPTPRNISRSAPIIQSSPRRPNRNGSLSAAWNRSRSHHKSASAVINDDTVREWDYEDYRAKAEAELKERENKENEKLKEKEKEEAYMDVLADVYLDPVLKAADGKKTEGVSDTTVIPVGTAPSSAAANEPISILTTSGSSGAEKTGRDQADKVGRSPVVDETGNTRISPTSKSVGFEVQVLPQLYEEPEGMSGDERRSRGGGKERDESISDDEDGDGGRTKIV